ncbi:MAG TPA: nitroreductase family protein [Thermoflexales bacterium]|jgi:nitroreductase|nr:nitroreductase family protein [Anaerolineae bacterium]HQY25785.1 nitroreductase family protein [Thermoflexales bacterium]HQZ52089.1 nitroreductase family protein [Thermoflexales bacterium]HRA53397.1 nitroreductase family protein [Thermoflexales bacterium]
MPFVPLASFERLGSEEMQRRARAFYDMARLRRTVRMFSNEAVPRAVIEDCIRAAGTAPSGANLQPWRFCVIADSAVKHEIRVTAEEEEREFYAGRAPREWLDALAPLGTDANKPFLETAPYLIAIFAQSYAALADGRKVKNYYVSESVGIATGILITALHQAGLATLTHTPSPMAFLNRILKRPENERPFLLLVTGLPSSDCVVPDIGKKPLEEIATFY